MAWTFDGDEVALFAAAAFVLDARSGEVGVIVWTSREASNAPARSEISKGHSSKMRSGMPRLVTRTSVEAYRYKLKGRLGAPRSHHTNLLPAASGCGSDLLMSSFHQERTFF